MSGSIVTGAEAAGATVAWQLRAWPRDPESLQLVLLDHLAVPTPALLHEAIETARRRGARRLRTSAMFPRAAEVATATGFAPIDTLALLSRPLGVDLDALLEARFGVAVPATDPIHRWQWRRAAEIDVAAFGTMWGNDRASLADTRRATPVHRARQVRVGRRMVGLAISGAAASAGYVQRVAVEPAAQRRGAATALVADALAWMRSRQLTTAFVNTGVDNAAALALYRRFGFVELAERLTIGELALTS